MTPSRATRSCRTASGGGAAGTAFDNYIKALREGKELPSPAEIDRITAGRYS